MWVIWLVSGMCWLMWTVTIIMLRFCILLITLLCRVAIAGSAAIFVWFGERNARKRMV